MPPYQSKHVAAVLGVYLAVVSVAAFVWALFIAGVGVAPAYALDSELIYRLQHALVVVAALTIPVLVVGPLLAGRLPAKLGREGIDWAEDREDVVAGLEDARERLSVLEEALRKIAEV